jgi:hypothetical protein
LTIISLQNIYRTAYLQKIYCQLKSKLAMRAFSLKKRIWSSF